jgi:hypothetical protein
MILLAAFFAASAASALAQTKVYRIDLAGGGTLWSDDLPMQSGAQVLFHGHPAGALKGLRRADIKRIVAVTVPTTAPGSIRPGEAVDIGATGAGARGRTASGRAAGGTPVGNGPLRPGEAKGGKALFNPDREYKPEWDGRLVPGSTIPLPNSPNDYREGATLAHPAAPATQSAPGDVPRSPN